MFNRPTFGGHINGVFFLWSHISVPELVEGPERPSKKEAHPTGVQIMFVDAKQALRFGRCPRLRPAYYTE